MPDIEMGNQLSNIIIIHCHYYLNTIIEVSVHMVQSSIFFAVNLIYGKLMIWYKINFF